MLATTYFLAQEATGFLLVIIYFIVFTLVVIIAIILTFSAFNEEIQITVRHQFSNNQSAGLLVIPRKRNSIRLFNFFFFFKEGGGNAFSHIIFSLYFIFLKNYLFSFTFSRMQSSYHVVWSNNHQGNFFIIILASYMKFNNVCEIQ